MPAKRPHDAEPNEKLQNITSRNRIFRVLCHDDKIERVIGSKISQKSGANIRVEETIPGCNERVIVIEEPQDNDAAKHDPDSCLHKGLMLVFQTMLEGDEDPNKVFAVRLLVLSSQVGPLMGSVVNTESGARIKVLPRDKLPSCASSSDVLIQISGVETAVRKGLQSVSQKLLEHPPDGGGRIGPFTDMLTYRLICSDEKVGVVIGKGGTIVKQLKHETGCDIKVLEKMAESNDRLIVISGPAHPDVWKCAPQDAVMRVQTRLFMDEPESNSVTAKVLVSAHQIGCIIGKGGAVISEMRKSTGAYIRILGKDQTPHYAAANEEVVQINGDSDAVKEALMQITTCLRNQYFRDEFPGFQDYGLPYMGRREHSPCAFNRFDGGGLRPRGGFHMHGDQPPFMRDRPDFPHPIYERLPSFVPWGPQGIEGGPLGFPDYGGRIMGGFGGGNHQGIITNTIVEVVVPRTVVPSIYGEDGGCLKQIREISEAKIIMNDPKPGAKETLIVISGTHEQTHAAQSLIQAFVICETEAS